MQVNMNRFSGILLGLFLGGVLVGAPAGFICAANGNPTAAAIFQIVAALCLLGAAISLIINFRAEKSNKRPLESKQLLQIMLMILALAIVVLVIMQMLAEQVRF